MSIQIDHLNKKPLVQQIIDQLQGKIARAELKPGDQLLPVRTLADQIGVNFNTVARAYRVLEALELVTTFQGRGSFINETTLPYQDRSSATEHATAESLLQEWETQAGNLGLAMHTLLQIWEARQPKSKNVVRIHRERAGQNNRVSRKIHRRPESIIRKSVNTRIPRTRKTRCTFHVKHRRTSGS